MKTHVVQLEGRSLTVEIKKHHWAKQMNMRISQTGQVRVTIPRYGTYRSAYAFIDAHTDWLLDKLPPQQSQSLIKKPTPQQRQQARLLVEAKLRQWNHVLGLRWDKVYIRNQSTRWGSCSMRGGLSFNWRIIELPEQLQDYLIVHELAHLQEHNHSPQFWAVVEKVLPNYKILRKKLKMMTLHT